MTQRQTPTGAWEYLHSNGNWYAQGTGPPPASRTLTLAPPATRTMAYPPPPGMPSYPPPPGFSQRPPVERPFNGMAIAAFILAFLFWPLGIVLGHISRHQIKRMRERGGGLALAALIISYFFLCVGVAALVVGEVVQHGAGGGPSQSQIQSLIQSDGPTEGVNDVASVNCDMPSSWAQGQTFTCYAYDASQQQVAQINGTVLPNDGTTYHFSEQWVPAAGSQLPTQ